MPWSAHEGRELSLCPSWLTWKSRPFTITRSPTVRCPAETPWDGVSGGCGWGSASRDAPLAASLKLKCTSLHSAPVRAAFLQCSASDGNACQQHCSPRAFPAARSLQLPSSRAARLLARHRRHALHAVCSPPACPAASRPTALRKRSSSAQSSGRSGSAASRWPLARTWPGTRRTCWQGQRGALLCWRTDGTGRSPAGTHSRGHALGSRTARAQR